VVAELVDEDPLARDARVGLVGVGFVGGRLAERVDGVAEVPVRLLGGDDQGRADLDGGQDARSLVDADGGERGLRGLDADGLGFIAGPQVEEIALAAVALAEESAGLGVALAGLVRREVGLGDLRGEEVAGALVGAEAGVEGFVDGAVDVDVDPLAGGAVLRPHLEGVAAGGGAVGLGDVAAEPGLLAVLEVAAADAVEEVAGADEPAGRRRGRR
jgi:hypothetical protein